MYARRRGSSLGDVSSVVTDISSFLKNIEGYAQGLQTETAKINNAINGAATGAQVGYNAPTNWTPLLIGGAVIVGLVLLLKD